MRHTPIGLVVAAATLWLALPVRLHAQPPAGYNQVKTNNVFKDRDPGGWAGSGTGSLEVSPSSTLPVDETETYGGLPSLRVNVQAPPSWWVALIVPRGWATADISDYYANGRLEFNVKGSAGGEALRVRAGRSRIRAIREWTADRLGEIIDPFDHRRPAGRRHHQLAARFDPARRADSSGKPVPAERPVDARAVRHQQ